jgi:hypothetical protein
MYLQVMPWVVIQEEGGIKGRERRENMRGENKVEHEWRFNIFPTYGHVQLLRSSELVLILSANPIAACHPCISVR